MYAPVEFATNERASEEPSGGSAKGEGPDGGALPSLSEPAEFPASELLQWYGVHGRATLPWRQTRDPYRIAVSEFMLQQTQVERVVPLYEAFIARFPSVQELAAAPLSDIVRAWKGLGYNSRAVRLHGLARAVVEQHAGSFPTESVELLALPGVGPYTAAAIRAFAFEENDVALDTNVRRVFHRVVYGFEHPRQATDSEIDSAALAAIPPGRSHDFNSALMDLGATICTSRVAKCLVCPLRDACSAAPIGKEQLAGAAAARAKKKSPQERVAFELSTRFVRGRIVDRLRLLEGREAISLLDLTRHLETVLPADRLDAVEPTVERLRSDGIVEAAEGGYRLAS